MGKIKINMSTNQLSDDLIRQYQTIISLPEKAFFVALANYARGVLDNPDLVSLQTELSKSALSDYDQTIEVLSKKTDTPLKKNWKMADFVKEGLKLAEKKKALDETFIKEQTEASHAWMRLKTLEMLVHDRNKAKSIYSKTPRGQQQYELSVTELDIILNTKANERNNEEYEFWVESGRKSSLQDVSRSIFVQSEYINYLNQVNTYLVSQINAQKVSSLIVFPEGETTLYQNGVLFFKLGDGTHDIIDFSTAPTQKKIFDVFWENKRRTLRDIISYEDALSLYKKLHGKEIDKRHFAYLISHIRGKINKKPHLINRIEFTRMDEIDSWKYNWC